MGLPTATTTTSSERSALIASALQCHRSGQFEQAEELYRQILQQSPDSIDALNLLGALLHQRGRSAEAETCFDRVRQLQPENPDVYNSLGIVLKAQGKRQAAVEHYQRAIALKPNHPEALNNLGNALKELGRVEDAIAAYQQALTVKPDYPEAHNNLGIALKDQDNLEAAAASYRQAIALQPGYAEAHSNLANVLQRQGDREGAVHHYRQSVELRPNHLDSSLNLGSLLQQQGHFAEAIALYQQLAKQKPNMAEIYYGWGNALQQQGNLEAAAAQYQQAIRLRSDYSEAYNNLGNVRQLQGRREEAIACYQETIRLCPSMAEAYSNLGAILKEQRQYEAAIGYFQKALELRPDYAEVHNNLGNVHYELGDLDTAIACYERSLVLNSTVAEVHSNLGNLLQQLGRYEEAFAHFQQAIDLRPDYPGTYNNLGIALRNCGQLEASYEAYDRAIELSPDFVEARWNRALNDLSKGDWQRGFAEYEWRWQWQKFLESHPQRSYVQPRWDGSPLDGKTLLLYAEQGLGDTIQFVRYVAIAVARGARVILECQPPLRNLLQGIPGVAEVITTRSPLPKFDVHAPLLSLPHILGTTVETVPAEPYLPISQTSAAVLPSCPSSCLKVGIVWEGNRENPYNRSRRLPLTELLRLGTIPNVRLFSLQKERTEAKQALLQAHSVEDLSAELKDFVDTAALIQSLDLVISADTAVAHLAGALGKPVWLLLPFAPDWRWLREGDRTPWYPTMRLFRQEAPNQWSQVFQAVGRSLAQQVSAEWDADAVEPAAALPVSYPSLPVVSHPALIAASTPIPSELKVAAHHYRIGEYRQAERLCQQVLAQGDVVEGWHLLGLIAHQEKQYDRAIGFYQKVLTLQPNHYETHNNLGVALQQQGNLNESLVHYERAIALKPDYADAHNNYANALREANRLDDAIREYRQAIANKPTFPDAYNNLGLALYAKNEFAEAADAYRQAIALKPDYPQAHNHLGNALKELGDLEQAARHYERAIALKPDYAKAFNNWGNIFRDERNLDTALRYYDRATELEPAFAEAHWNKALTYLLMGDLKRGFAEYEWRWQVKLPTFHVLRSFSSPLWDGKAPLAGKTVFLHAEQGMGDILQFVRYARLLAEQGAHIILECHTPLLNLLRQLPYVQQVVPYGSPPPAFDLHAPLLSLPHLLGTTLETVPAAVPYLPTPSTNAVLPTTATGTASIETPLRVGLVWSGNPENSYNRTRAVPLAQLLELTQLPNIHFYSLQKQLPPGDREPLQANSQICDLHDRLTDFVDTAALIQQLDLIISVDTAVAHLAGGLGKPVWLLLPFAPDWRWMIDRSDTPWYPTMRLFRQPHYGDWAAVLAQVKQALMQQTGLEEATSEPLPETRKTRSGKKRSRTRQTASEPAVNQPNPSAPAETTVVSIADGLNQAIAAYHNGELEEAKQLCFQVLQQEPDQAQAHNVLGVIFCQKREFAAAIAQLRRVLELQPGAVDAMGNLANALWEQGKAEEAIAYYQQAVTLAPDYADGHQNLSIVLREMGRLEDAIVHANRAVVLGPDRADAHYNHGFLLRQMGNLPEAIARYRQAIALQPDFVSAHKNLGHALLLAGDLQEGFAEYEWRWRQEHWQRRACEQPLWDGSPIAGKTILLYPEQGFGDTIQFIRYASLLQKQGARVVVECQPELFRLLKTAPGVDYLAAAGSPLPDFDVHAPLLSLPHLLKTTLETIPATIPYLAAPDSPPALPEGASRRFKVGIVWSGNPLQKNNHARSCRLQQFEPLTQLAGVQLYSLQKGAAAADLQESALPIHDLSPQLRDFADTAAAIAQLDLVITVDTAVAHLAGALGKPVWLVLSFAPDWRWMVHRSDSPWYPTIRLFRQPKSGDWASVFEQVQSALEATVQPLQESGWKPFEIGDRAFVEVWAKMATPIPALRMIIATRDRYGIFESSSESSSEVPTRICPTYDEAAEVLKQQGYVLMQGRASA